MRSPSSSAIVTDNVVIEFIFRVAGNRMAHAGSEYLLKHPGKDKDKIPLSYSVAWSVTHFYTTFHCIVTKSKIDSGEFLLTLCANCKQLKTKTYFLYNVIIHNDIFINGNTCTGQNGIH